MWSKNLFYSTFQHFLLLRLLNSILCTKTKKKSISTNILATSIRSVCTCTCIEASTAEKGTKKTERPKRRSLAGLWKNVKNLNSYFLHTRKIHWIATESAPSSDQAGVKCEVAEQRRRKRALKIQAEKNLLERLFFVSQLNNVSTSTNRTTHNIFISFQSQFPFKWRNRKIVLILWCD